MPDAGGRNRSGPQANEGDDGLSNTNNPHWGSTLDEFLVAEGTGEVAKAEAVIRVVAWQLAQAMARQGITKARLAEEMHTGRAQVD